MICCCAPSPTSWFLPEIIVIQRLRVITPQWHAKIVRYRRSAIKNFSMIVLLLSPKALYDSEISVWILNRELDGKRQFSKLQSATCVLVLAPKGLYNTLCLYSCTGVDTCAKPFRGTITPIMQQKKCDDVDPPQGDPQLFSPRNELM